MARFTGKDGVVQVDSNVIAELLGYDVNSERAVARAPIMGSGFVGHGVGAPATTGTIRCLYDPTDTTAQQALYGDGPFALTFHPQGTGTGLPESSLAVAYVSGIPQTVASEEFVTIEFAFVADSALVQTTQV